MRRKMKFWRGVGVLAAVVMLAGIAPASAQTNGMERRGDRHDGPSRSPVREAGLQSRR